VSVPSGSILAEAVAGAISMGGGSYLASQAEEQLYVSEIAAEGRKIDEFPNARRTSSPSSSKDRRPSVDGRAEELGEDDLAAAGCAKLEREGLSREQTAAVARGLASNPNVFLHTKAQKERGLSPDAGGAALGDAVVVGATYLGAAIVPLWPYFLSLNVALAISLTCTLLALFTVGVARAL
jgi:VIT1/CCC1 family predicted Fe2+/Mn2+ transporter